MSFILILFLPVASVIDIMSKIFTKVFRNLFGLRELAKLALTKLKNIEDLLYSRTTKDTVESLWLLRIIIKKLEKRQSRN